jgi:hypothetical protein
MNDLRTRLHRLVDLLPDHALEHARIALDYCNDPEKQRMTIEKAKQRAKERSERVLRELADRSGKGFISNAGSGGGSTFADGNHHSSMVAFEDGKEATYHLYVFRGHTFEVVETIEISANGDRLIRRERITGANGNERILTAELPIGSAR